MAGAFVDFDRRIGRCPLADFSVRPKFRHRRPRQRLLLCRLDKLRQNPTVRLPIPRAFVPPALRLARLIPCEHPIGILELISDFHFHRRVPKSLCGQSAAGFDRIRAGSIGPQPPHCATQHMCARMANPPAAQSPSSSETAPFEKRGLYDCQCNGPKPKIPIQFRRRIFVRDGYCRRPGRVCSNKSLSSLCRSRRWPDNDAINRPRAANGLAIRFA